MMASCLATVWVLANSAERKESGLGGQEYPNLFSAVFRFYENKGVRFWGIDLEEDYAYLIDHLIADNVLA